MKLTTRFRVRTLMAIVASVALGFGVTFELKNHAERDRLLKAQFKIYRYAAIHQMRALECKFAEGKLPYRPAERMKLLSSDLTRGWLPSVVFPSWQVECEYHKYWGTRFYDQAESWNGNLQAVEAKLLLP